MKKTLVQIQAKEYKDLDYLDKQRWINMWYQINEVVITHPKTVLEVGIGNGIVSTVLKLLEYKVITIDIDSQLKPDYVGDVRKLPFKKASFDTILCAEVLEHIPFADVLKALAEMYRITKKFVILSLPHDYLTYFSLEFKLFPYQKPITYLQTIPRFQAHVFNGQHYWEIGKKGFSLSQVKNLFFQVGFKLIKTYCLSENPYYRFFVLKK